MTLKGKVWGEQKLVRVNKKEEMQKFMLFSYWQPFHS